MKSYARDSKACDWRGIPMLLPITPRDISVKVC